MVINSSYHNMISISMKKIILLGLLLIFLGIVGIFVYHKRAVAPIETLDQQCVAAGGQVEETLCCGGANAETQTSFPNLCVIGACGCAPKYSRPTKICNCGEGKCFDGKACVQISH